MFQYLSRYYRITRAKKGYQKYSDRMQRIIECLYYLAHTYISLQKGGGSFDHMHVCDDLGYIT